MITYEKCTSTSEYEVERAINGLVKTNPFKTVLYHSFKIDILDWLKSSV